MNFSSRYDVYYKEFERELAKRCAAMNFRPPVLTESMRYSLLSGGKRVRPVLFLGALDALGAEFRSELPIAVSIEAIHTYSLIHDDLPAMDNDDYRRGKPSSHKQFGEANAVLAGDALLSYAFSLLLEEAGRDGRHLQAAREISDAAGAAGMIAGQSADLLYEGAGGGEEELFFVYRHKTGKLIAAPVVAAAILAGRGEEAMRSYGESLGVLFQLTDDILDVKGEALKMGKPLGKDREEDKLTCVKVFGMEKSERLADEYAEKCRAAAESLNTDFLAEFATFVRTRNH